MEGQELQHQPAWEPTPQTPGQASGWWPRLQRWQRVALVAGSAVVFLALIGGLIALNLAASGQKTPMNPGTRKTSGTSSGQNAVAQASPRGTASSLNLPPSGWKWFEGDEMSVVLPDTWIGGKPEEARVAIGRAFKSNQAMMAATGAFLQTPGLQLLALGELEKGAPLALMVAVVEPLPQSQTLQQVAYATAALVPNTEVTFDSVGNDQTICRFTYDPSGQGGPKVSRVILIRAGDRVCIVSYSAADALAYELETVFQTSMARIAIKPFTETTTSLVGV